MTPTADHKAQGHKTITSILKAAGRTYSIEYRTMLRTTTVGNPIWTDWRPLGETPEARAWQTQGLLEHQAKETQDRWMLAAILSHNPLTGSRTYQTRAVPEPP